MKRSGFQRVSNASEWTMNDSSSLEMFSVFSSSRGSFQFRIRYMFTDIVKALSSMLGKSLISS